MRTIVCDLDGTLLDNQGMLMEKTKNKLIELQSKGIKLILASGRSYTRMLSIAEELEMDLFKGHIIDSNGISIIDMSNMERKRLALLNSEEGKSCFKLLNNLGLEIQFVQDDAIYLFLPNYLKEYKNYIAQTFNLSNDFPLTGGDGGWIYDMRDGYKNTYIISNPNEIPNFFNKIIISHDEAYLDKCYNQIKKLDEFKNFSMFRTSSRTVDIMPLNISKGNALKVLMNDEKIESSQVLAFGDSENDLSMFDCVGSSVAMENGLDIVQEHATYVTGLNTEEGIYQFLIKQERGR